MKLGSCTKPVAMLRWLVVCRGLNVSPAYAKSDPAKENDPGNGSEDRSHNTQPALAFHNCLSQSSISPVVCLCMSPNISSVLYGSVCVCACVGSSVDADAVAIGHRRGGGGV